MPGTAYNPYDPAQARLLGALALSEVGRSSDPYDLGTGGFDLSNADRDEYGFPQWGGVGNSHAAGAFQFQPGTWEGLAKTYGLDFRSPADQNAAAWYHAQDTYRAETGGDLSAAIKAGDYSSIEAALGRTQWIGARGKLAEFLSGGQSADLGDASAEDMAAAVDNNRRTGGVLGRFLGDTAAGVGDTVTRFLLFAIGAILLLVAVWWLLSGAGVVPGPGKVAKVAALAS